MSDGRSVPIDLLLPTSELKSAGLESPTVVFLPGGAQPCHWLAGGHVTQYPANGRSRHPISCCKPVGYESVAGESQPGEAGGDAKQE